MKFINYIKNNPLKAVGWAILASITMSMLVYISIFSMIPDSVKALAKDKISDGLKVAKGFKELTTKEGKNTVFEGLAISHDWEYIPNGKLTKVKREDFFLIAKDNK